MINKISPNNYNTVQPIYIVDYIKDYSKQISEMLSKADREALSNKNKHQLKAMAAELETVYKRLKWIMDGIY